MPAEPVRAVRLALAAGQPDRALAFGPEATDEAPSQKNVWPAEVPMTNGTPAPRPGAP